MVTKPNGDPSPLYKYKYSNGKTEEGKGYMVGTVLRDNGRIEFYSDFMLVEEYYRKNKPCVDIETDATIFYYKFKEKKKDEFGNERIQNTFKKVKHFWRNRISMATGKKIKEGEKKWGIVLHRRIANYFKIYTTICNFANFILVAHRNMISVFDMNDPQKKWIDNIEVFDEPIRCISVKKKGLKDHRDKVHQSNLMSPKLADDKNLQAH